MSKVQDEYQRLIDAMTPAQRLEKSVILNREFPHARSE